MRAFFMILAISASIPAWPLYAETKSLSLEDLIAQALRTGQATVRIDSDLASKVADAITSGLLQNPSIEGGVDMPLNPPTEGTEDPNIAILVAQPVRGSDFGARGDLERLLKESGNADKIVAINELIQEIEILYTSVWQSQERFEVLKRGRDKTSRVLKIVTNGVQRGLFGTGDTEFLKAEVATFDADLQAAAADGTNKRAELLRRTGVSNAGVEFEKPHIDAVVARDELLSIVREGALPIQKRYALLTRVAEQQKRVSELDASFSLTPRVGFGRHDDGTSQALVGFSIPLPFFDRNQGDRVRAEGERIAADRQQEYFGSRGFEEEAGLLHDSFTNLLSQLKIHEGRVLPARRRALEAYTGKFQAGSGTVLQIWQAIRELRDAEMRVVELYGGLMAERARIKALTGQPVL